MILTGAHTFHSHAALGFVVEHEQEILAPQLSFERGSAVLRAAGAMIAPAFTRFVEPDLPSGSASGRRVPRRRNCLNPSELVRLDDPAKVRGSSSTTCCPA